VLEDDILALIHRKLKPGNKQETEIQIISSGTEEEKSCTKP